MKEEIKGMFDYSKIINNSNYPWVIFIHGFGGSSVTWKGQIDAYSKYFNLLLLNLHSDSTKTYVLDIKSICENIHASLENEKIKEAFFVSMSSGSLVALAYASYYPETVKAMIMAGGMIQFNSFTRTLLFFARKLKKVIPYLTLYKFFAHIIMPGKNHKKSREIFVRESDKLGHVEFAKWVDLLPLLIDNQEVLEKINTQKIPIPFVYIMGIQDHLFKNPILKDVSLLKDAKVILIKDCGHVCTIEKAEEFNKLSTEYLLDYLKMNFEIKKQQ
ncbi:MAG TPA: alpha/beta hydrolase [Clostridia bacterium]|nr:MAG: 2-succinyl-6-hydroxy-2,4-cyclohexadiene-1-carboxylate synthase [Firmicutes bacterium ADurb.Bin146]HOD93656.1 alpha/beta hydrolase [Clostridia bacterium]HQM39892.1 alpha/beta hydrolase [Clostridia bacterium]